MQRAPCGIWLLRMRSFCWPYHFWRPSYAPDSIIRVLCGTWFTFRILTAYCTFTLVPIIGKLGADNWYVPIIGDLRYSLKDIIDDVIAHHQWMM